MFAALVGSKVFGWLIKLWPLWLGFGIAIVGWVWMEMHDANVAREAVRNKESELRLCQETVRQAALAVQESRDAVKKVLAANAEQATRVAELEKNEAAARARGDKVMAEYHAKERRLLTQLKDLKAKLEQPAATPELSCSEADDILLDLAVKQKADMP